MRPFFEDVTGFIWEDAVHINRGRGQVKQDPIQVLKHRLAGMAFADKYTPPELREPPPGVMGFDVETEDPDLMTIGSSWALGRGTIIGFSVAWEGYEAYFPLRHVSGNVDEIQPLAWLKHQLQRADLTFVCTNAPYDIGWARQELGLYPRGGAIDVQHMAAILDEFALHYSLEHIAQTYVGQGKITTRLDELERQLGVKHIHLMSCLRLLPGPVIASYAAGDATRTLQCYHAMLPMIKAQGLMPIFELESSLICMTSEMRRIGIKVDIDKAIALSEDIRTVKMPAVVNEINRLTGITVSPWDADSCYDALTKAGVKGIKKTKDGSWSINKEMLALNENIPVAKHILDLRQMSKISGTFIDGHIVEHAVNGRLHPQFNQLRSERDESGSGVGTVTGRFSATGPALQQIPVRHEIWGPLIRSLFLPEEGEEIVSRDFSAQEPRMAVHFAAKAKIKGAAEAVEAYKLNPRMKYHQYVADLAGTSYNNAKTINLALAYGAGQAKIARALGLPTQWMKIERCGNKQVWDKIKATEVDRYRSQGISCVEVAGDEGKRIIEAWEKGAPFIKGLYNYAMEVANERGYIMTILRRRCRFMEERGGNRFSMTYKALNKLCQGSSADQIKKAMQLLWGEKIIPRLPIHDELVTSEPRENRTKHDRVKEIMEHAIELLVPSVVDVKYGATWGDIPK